MDVVRDIIFKHNMYDKVNINVLMYMPQDFISPDDTMKIEANKFETSGRYNIAVIENGKYSGLISGAKVFTNYRKQITDVSHI